MKYDVIKIGELITKNILDEFIVVEKSTGRILNDELKDFTISISNGTLAPSGLGENLGDGAEVLGFPTIANTPQSSQSKV